MDFSPVTEPLYPRVLERRPPKHKLDLFRFEVVDWGIRGLCSCGDVDIKLDNHLLWTGDPLFDSKEGAQS